MFNQIRADPTMIMLPYPMTMWVLYSIYPQIHSCMWNNRSIACSQLFCRDEKLCLSLCTI